MRQIAGLINDALENPTNPERLAQIKKEVVGLTKKFPLYAELLK